MYKENVLQEIKKSKKKNILDSLQIIFTNLSLNHVAKLCGYNDSE